MVDRQLALTRSKAQSLIMARRVTVNGQYADKPGTSTIADDLIEIIALEHPYVGRGGMKLAGALAHFNLDVRGLICADIGASTGGFTDVLLRGGAAKVYAIDVGYGQIDQSLREHPQVINREKVNARYLEKTDFDDDIAFCSVDVSFISLKMILPAVSRILIDGGTLVSLIKPQFEVGKKDLGKGGIVRDVEKRQESVEAVVAFARESGFDVRGLMESPVKGAEGNVEFLMHAVWGAATPT